MNKDVVLKSLNSNFKDFEDALQNYSAVKNVNIKVILTRNIKGFKYSELSILTPESILKRQKCKWLRIDMSSTTHLITKILQNFRSYSYPNR